MKNALVAFPSPVRKGTPMPVEISHRFIRSLFVATALVALFLGAIESAFAASNTQPKSFASPQDAATALFDATKAKDQKAIIEILGPSYRDWIVSGDPVQDAQRLERFATAYGENSTVINEGENKASLTIGKDDYPFPFPIVKRGDKWQFDPEAGKNELLNRAIGRNELETIQTLLAIVDAQREYAQRDRNDNGVPDYATKFKSSPGKKDGLYWVAQPGEPESPLGPLVAGAVREGYKARNEGPIPFHGYYFRLLRGQGAQAPGGAYDYVVKGKMIGGFAVLAYPARYGISGVKTFAVNHDGVVYDADLGAKTETVAPKIKLFNPDGSWKKVEK